MRHALHDSELETTRRYWRERAGCTQEEIDDPQPLLVIRYGEKRAAEITAWFERCAEIAWAKAYLTEAARHERSVHSGPEQFEIAVGLRFHAAMIGNRFNMTVLS